MQRFQQQRHALGSDATLTIITEDGNVFEQLWKMIETFEQRFSRFRSDSELSTFNANAGQIQKVSDEFRALLLTAKTMAEKTGGLYNPFVLPALQRAGYKGSWPSPEKFDKRLNYETRGVVAWQTIEANGDTATIPHDSALDFGGIGKGYLLDELAHWLRRKGVTNFWLSLGGDIMCSGFDLEQKPWCVSIQKALEPNETAATVANETGALMAIATSGVTKRKGETPNGAWHHLIDPRTGAPASTNVLTATVCADEGVTADVLAKCLVIAGTDNFAELVKQYEPDGALMQQSVDETVAVTKIGAIWSK